ncbi:MAG: hypothetical protein CMB80_03700 [Flammeovirgaceae bacterium]|nr:hypothetical protein [Flammeovirgaceae bacterium]
MKSEEEYILSHMKKSANFELEVRFICTHFNFDIFVDAGPNAPFTEAWFVRQKKPGCHISGFEPHPDAFKKLCAYFYPGMLYPRALSDSPGTIRGIYDQNHELNFAKINNETMAESVGITMDDLIEVETVSVDQVIEHTLPSSSTFVWADVEGSELDIIMGARKSLEANKICGFMLELNTSAEKKCGCYWKEAVQAVRDYGFSPIGLFNLQPTHFDCIFAKFDGPVLWSDDELSSMLDRLVEQYAQDASHVPMMHTIDHVRAGMSFL